MLAREKQREHEFDLPSVREAGVNGDRNLPLLETAVKGVGGVGNTELGILLIREENWEMASHAVLGLAQTFVRPLGVSGLQIDSLLFEEDIPRAAPVIERIGERRLVRAREGAHECEQFDARLKFGIEIPDDNLLLVEVTHLKRDTGKKPVYIYKTAVSHDGRERESLCDEFTVRHLICRCRFVRYFMRVHRLALCGIAHRKYPLGADPRRIHDRDHDARSRCDGRKLVRIELAADRSFVDVIPPGEHGHGRVLMREDMPQRRRRDSRVMHELNAAVVATIPLSVPEITVPLGAG